MLAANGGAHPVSQAVHEQVRGRERHAGCKAAALLSCRAPIPWIRCPCTHAHPRTRLCPPRRAGAGPPHVQRAARHEPGPLPRRPGARGVGRAQPAAVHRPLLPLRRPQGAGVRGGLGGVQGVGLRGAPGGVWVQQLGGCCARRCRPVNRAPLMRRCCPALRPPRRRRAPSHRPCSPPPPSWRRRRSAASCAASPRPPARCAGGCGGPACGAHPAAGTPNPSWLPPALPGPQAYLGARPRLPAPAPAARRPAYKQKEAKATMKPLGRMLAKIMHAAPLPVAEQLIRQVRAWRDGPPGGWRTRSGGRLPCRPTTPPRSLAHPLPSPPGHGHAGHGDQHRGEPQVPDPHGL